MPTTSNPVCVRTPRSIIDSVLRSVCGRESVRLDRIAHDGLNETYRAFVNSEAPLVVRIARRSEPWFTQEALLMAQARTVGVPTPDVLGIRHVEHQGEVLSFSVLQMLAGKPLSELAGTLPTLELERLVAHSARLMARLHSVSPPEQGQQHAVLPVDVDTTERALRIAEQVVDASAAVVVQRGVELISRWARTSAAPKRSLVHGDWLPKHLMIGDAGMIVGVIDWEFSGSGSPAVDLAHWEVAAIGPLHNRWAWLHRGYTPIAGRNAIDDGWVSVFAVQFALEMLGWKKPAPDLFVRRCIEVLARHTRI